MVNYSLGLTHVPQFRTIFLLRDIMEPLAVSTKEQQAVCDIW